MFSRFTIIISVTVKSNFTKEKEMYEHIYIFGCISYTIIHVYEYLYTFIHIYTYFMHETFFTGTL